MRYKRATNSLIFSTLLPRLYAVRPPRRRVYIVLNISKNLRIPRIRTGFFQIKVGTLPHRYPPPIRIGANYSSTQRYLGNPRSPMSMQCGTAEKFGNLVYFAILSQYNTEGSLQVGCLFLEMKMKQKKAAQSLRSLSIASDSKQPNTNKIILICLLKDFQGIYATT